MAPPPTKLAWARALVFPAALAVTLLAYLDTLRFGLVGDARFLIADNRHLDSWAYLADTLTRDYFWSSSGASIPYWRPLTKLCWLVEARLFGREPWVFHAAHLGWLLAAVAGVYALARRLGAPGPWAGVAAALFGLHPALVEPGCLVMARSDVAALACSLWATAAWHAWRAEPGAPPRRRAALAAAHGVAFALALASKESAVVLPAAWTAWALAMRRDPGVAPDPRWLRTLAPSWILAAAYLVARARLLGVVAPSPSPDPLRVFVGAGAYGAGLVPFRLSTGVRNLAHAEARSAAWLALASGVWLAALAGAAVALRRRRSVPLGLAAIAGASLLPVLLGPTPHVPAIAGKYPLADRWLVTAAAVTAVGLGVAFARLPARLRAAAAAAVALWAAASVVTAPAAHAWYRGEDTMLELEEAQYRRTPPEFHTPEDRCRAVERGVTRAAMAGDADRVLALARSAPAACVAGSLRFDVLSALVRAHRYADARPLVDPLLADATLERRLAAPARFLAGVTLLRTGEPARAERLLSEALAAGVRSCAMLGLLAEAAEAQGRADEAALRRARFESCRAAFRGRHAAP